MMGLELDGVVFVSVVIVSVVFASVAFASVGMSVGCEMSTGSETRG